MGVMFALQLAYAKILAGLYCLVQMLVLVGLIVEMAGQPVCYPTTVFFLFVTFTFVLSAVLHPQVSGASRSSG